MRWQHLFDDLEAQLEGETAGAFDAELADRIRGELARTTLEDRLRGRVGGEVTLFVTGLGQLDGRLRRVGTGWLVVEEARGLDAVVAMTAVTGVRDLPVAARGRDIDGPVNARLGLAAVLGVLSRDRAVVSIELTDRSRMTGTIDRVGTDYLDLAQHPLDESRRPEAVSAIRSIAFRAIAVVRASR